MAGEKNLVFLLDYSGSMFSHQTTVSGARRIDVLKEKLGQFLQKHTGFATIEGYCFASALEHLGSFGDAQSFMDAFRGYKHPLGGGTLIWDALGESIDDLDDEAEVYMVCITDGEDTGSRLSYQDVRDRAAHNPNLTLHIIDIEGTLKDTLPDEPVVTAVDDLERLDEDLGAIVEKKVDLSLTRPAGLPISVPLVNLVPCDKDTIDLVVQGVRNAVGYLEGLTGLRYYPVTTFVTDKLDRRRPKKIPPPDPELFKVISEMLGFLHAVCLTFHSGVYSEDIKGSDWYEPYKGYSQLDKDIRTNLVSLAEFFIPSIYKFLRTGVAHDLQRYYIKGLYSSTNQIVITKESLEYILDILRGIERLDPHIKLSGQYFIREYYSWEPKAISPIIDPWQIYIDDDEYTILTRCIDRQGKWRRDIRSIVKAMAIIIPAVFKLIYRYRAQTGPYTEILEVMHLWGVYYPAGSQEVEKLLSRKDFPYTPAIHGSGKVVLCLDTLRESFQKLQDDQKEWEHTNIADLLLSVIVHEHTHAITTEGIGTGDESIYSQRPRSSGKRTELVSEALAEWAELNYFRNHELLYDLIFTHASCGPPSEWPYAGALFFEQRYTQKTGDEFFRSVLNAFRQDGKQAYRMLIEKPVL